jgi:hypothetical protein
MWGSTCVLARAWRRIAGLQARDLSAAIWRRGAL